jgi:capsular polysaccharide biosynthesis protein
VSHPYSRRKVLIETRRRGWLVLLSIVLVSLVAWAGGKALSRSYSAEAVLVVRAGGPLAAQPDASSKLATTYATLIPLDARIQTAVEQALPSDQNVSFTASNDANTAILRVTFEAPKEQEAVEGALAVTHAITGRKPLSPSIAPNSVAIVRLPSSAKSSGGTSTELATVGAALGLLLGLVLVAFWRSHDTRIDELRELRDQLTCPCFDIDLKTGSGFRPLVDAVIGAPGGTTAVLPCRERDIPFAEALRELLGDTLGAERLIRAAPPGSEDAGELLAAAADTTILTVAPGVRLAEVLECVDLLGRYGSAPTFAILGRKRPSGKAPKLAPADETDALLGNPTD